MFNFFYSNSVFNNDNCLHLIPFHQKIAFNIETVKKFICMLYKSQLVYIAVKDDMDLLESNLESSIDQFQRYCYRYLLKCFGSKNNVFKLKSSLFQIHTRNPRLHSKPLHSRGSSFEPPVGGSGPRFPLFSRIIWLWVDLFDVFSSSLKTI